MKEKTAADNVQAVSEKDVMEMDVEDLLESMEGTESDIKKRLFSLQSVAVQRLCEAGREYASMGLIVAATHGMKELCEGLIQGGAVVDCCHGEPLVRACRCGKLSTAQLLLEAGACVDGHSGNKYRPLYIANDRPYPEICLLLLKHNVDVNVVPQGTVICKADVLAKMILMGWNKEKEKK